MSADVFARAFDEDPLAADIEFRTLDPSRKGYGAWGTGSTRESEGSPEEIDGWLDGHTVLVVHAAPVTRELLQHNPSVRLVACARGGPVNIDLGAAKDLGVTITTTPGKNADAVADLTIGFLISLWRNLSDATNHLATAELQGLPVARSTFEGAHWFGRELAGRRLGLVGLGHVARLVAKRARALDLDVVAYDPFVPIKADTGISRVESLDELLSGSEAVSLHARATADNRHMIGSRELALMPQGSVLINTARETLLDEYALLRSLHENHIHGAAIDVWEPDGPWREIVAHPRSVVTPHIGGATYETLDRGARMLRDELNRYLHDQTLLWAVS